ncbi:MULTISPECIES: hypothetical protein [unclassified Lysinibacillus]|uniref:hypothetical protein n=1 Tax=unclassified Lysinibacillus TaxID=2636778 RepID=UPI003812D04E
MMIEFFPQITRLLENKAGEVEVYYLNYSWLAPSIGVRPPYYCYPIYQPYFALL